MNKEEVIPMETETISIPKLVNKRQKIGINGKRISFHIPEYLLRLVDEEAKEKGQTRANVMAYLMLAGLKAHCDEFRKPSNNTIKQNWIKRGRKW